VTSTGAEPADHPAALLALYDRALPEVYGYLVRRCPSSTIAEDLTSETFMAAVDAARRGAVQQVTVPWLVTIARNRLVDHWRREARRERDLRLVAAGADDVHEEPGFTFEHEPARRALGALGAHHRLALTLRYLDGLAVHEVAEQLDRTVHATEALLVRARRAFRAEYLAEEGR
jgi:RNA polymerase sigma-70 factor (ECF subfamily)